MEYCKKCFEVKENRNFFYPLRTCETLIRLIQRKKIDDELLKAIIKKFFEVKNNLMDISRAELTALDFKKFEYIYACISAYPEVRQTNYEGFRHPYLHGGIPLSKEVRESFKGVHYPEHGNFDPIFEEEKNEEGVHFEALPNTFEIRREKEPCECGATKTTSANYYFKNYQTWPF